VVFLVDKMALQHFPMPASLHQCSIPIFHSSPINTILTSDSLNKIFHFSLLLHHTILVSTLFFFFFCPLDNTVRAFLILPYI
jgi:hypothetical protein